jgi:hypothetical protein
MLDLDRLQDVDRALVALQSRKTNPARPLAREVQAE